LFFFLTQVNRVSNVLWKQFVFGPDGLQKPKLSAWQLLTAKNDKTKRRKKGDPPPVKIKPLEYPVLMAQVVRDASWFALKHSSAFVGKNCFPLNSLLNWKSAANAVAKRKKMETAGTVLNRVYR
jgi:hypothetical protein